MPADIRNFFGGKGAPPARKVAEAPESQDGKSQKNGEKRRGKPRKVIEDSDDEDTPPASKKVTPKKAASKKIKREESPKGEETTTADYFAKSTGSKSTKSTPVKAKVEPNGRGSGRSRTKFSTYAEHDDDGAFIDDDPDAGDDIFAASMRGKKRNGDDYAESQSEDDVEVVSAKVTPKAKSRSRKSVDDDDMMDIDDKPSNNGTRAKSNGAKKRKSADVDEEDDYEEDEVRTRGSSRKKGSPTKPPAKKPRSSPKKAKEDVPESAEIQAIFDSIPTVRAPSPPPKDDNAKPFNWRLAAGGQPQPPAAGSKEIPAGAENCLTGLTFVFTGLLESISREEGQELVKRYGGKVTGAPSSKTSYVVLGSDAGPKKLEKIKQMSIKTIDENGLFELIRRLPANGGDGKLAEKAQEKRRAEEEKIREEARNMEIEEKKRATEAAAEARRVAVARGHAAPTNITPKADPNAQLWTVKYAPTQMNQICGNKSQVEKIQRWLHEWPKSHKFHFSKPGPDGFGRYRAIIVSGPPGIGKTTAAHLAAKLEGYDVLESNASDTRSKKLVEGGLKDVLDNSSLLGFFAGDGKEVHAEKKKIVMIMDEVDGMSGGDRGGVGALAKMCKKTDIPIILICNERKIPKMKPFDFVTYDVPFRRPTVDQVRSRVATICHREGLKISKEVMDALIEGSNKDIRQIVNMLSTAKLDQTGMDFDQSKEMSKAWEKHVILKPWDICHKLLGGGMFAPSSKSTLNDKIELYFNDHEFSYLMIQENYLKTKPLLASNQHLSEREFNLKTLELVDKAAESISDGDLVDRMIHGSQQQWSLMPTHAVFSAVRPSSLVSGAITGQPQFTAWLGNNSKLGKLSRYVKEIQSHMRLRTSADRHEIRQQYLPVLWTQIIERLKVTGADAVEEIIDLMDSYFLTRDDFDYMVELGLGPQDEEQAKMATQTKANFTRSYNSRSHPMPFMKASSVVAPAKAARDVPDLEEAIEESDDEIVDTEPKGDDEDEADEDISKDKYIKKPKAKKASAPKKTAAKKGKANETDDAEDGAEDDGEAKKARGQKGKGGASRSKGKK